MGEEELEKEEESGAGAGGATARGKIGRDAEGWGRRRSRRGKRVKGRRTIMYRQEKNDSVVYSRSRKKRTL